MKKKSSAYCLVSLIISMLVFGGSMKLIAVANDSGSFLPNFYIGELAK